MAGAGAFKFLKVLLSRQRDTSTTATNESYLLKAELFEVKKNGGNIDCTSLDVLILDPTVAQDTISGSADTESPLGPFSTDHWFTFRFVPYDAGDASGTGWIELYVNSVAGATMRIGRLSPKDSIHPNSTNLDCSTDIAAATASTWHGIVVDGNSSKKDTGWPPALTGSGLDAKGFGGRFVRKSTAQSNPPQPEGW